MIEISSDKTKLDIEFIHNQRLSGLMWRIFRIHLKSEFQILCLSWNRVQDEVCETRPVRKKKKGEEPGYALPLERRNLEIVYWFS